METASFLSSGPGNQHRFTSDVYISHCQAITESSFKQQGAGT